MTGKKKEEQARQNGQTLPEELEQTVEEAQAAEAEAAPAAEDVEALRQELEAARAEARQNLDGWQRALAEFQNYKKRVERDREKTQQEITGRVLLRYLEVLDDLELALKNAPKRGKGAEWAKGIELIYRKLRNLLEAEGVQPIDAEGRFFDHNLHEAISHEEAEGFESGQIIEVVRQGYRLGDRVLRPALVRVAR